MPDAQRGFGQRRQIPQHWFRGELAALQVDMLNGQPRQVLASIHAAVSGRLVYQGLKLDGDTNRNRFSSADLAWVVFWFPGHKELAIIFLITVDANEK